MRPRPSATFPLWEILADETSVKTLAGRSAKGCAGICRAESKNTVRWWINRKGPKSSRDYWEDCGYLDALKAEDTDEAKDRLGNVQELYNAVLQFEEENEDPSLLGFLANASLTRIWIMWTRASKLGLADDPCIPLRDWEFPVGVPGGAGAGGCSPTYRSLEDPAATEGRTVASRYVGITRAKERLFICPTPANAAALRQPRNRPALPYFWGNCPRSWSPATAPMSLPQKWTTSVREVRKQKEAAAKPGSGAHEVDWNVGDVVVHQAYGAGGK